MALALCCTSVLHAQSGDRKMALSFNNPLGIASKIRLKAEYRLDIQKSVLVNYTVYYGFFPGYEAGVEYRSYWETLGMDEYFVYGRLGLGNVGYRKVPILGGQSMYGDPGNFFFGGAGVGKHWCIKGNFFIDGSIGAKFTGVATQNASYNEVLFYSTGPGAVVDLNLSFGWQLF